MRKQPPWLCRANRDPSEQPTVAFEFNLSRAAEYRVRAWAGGDGLD